MTLPEGWVETTFAEIGRWGSGGTPKATIAEYYGGTIPWIRSGDLPDGPVLSHEINITDIGLEKSSAKWVTPGSILIAMYGATIGKLGVVTYPVTTNQAVAFVDPFDGIDGRYFFENLRYRKSELINLGQGGAQPNISQEILKAQLLPVPPVAEQRRIVAKLDALTARLARARAELDRVPVLASYLRRGILSRAFSGALTANWRSEHGRSDVKWPVRPLSDIADVQGGIQVGKKRADNAVLIDTPYLRVANVQRGWLKLDEIKTLGVTPEERARLLLRDGDILMNEGGDRDKLGRGWVWRGEVADCIHQNHVFRIRLKDNQFPSEFVSHYANEFGQPYFIDQGTQTTNLASISKRRVMALPVPVPDAHEATEVVRQIDAAFARADRMEAEAARARALLDRLEAAILAKAFRGELVPQDPDDEPAHVLLDRIRAERAAAPKPKRGRRTKESA